MEQETEAGYEQKLDEAGEAEAPGEATKKQMPGRTIPINRISEATVTRKVVSLGTGFGISLPWEILQAMELQKGMMVKVTIERCRELGEE